MTNTAQFVDTLKRLELLLPAQLEALATDRDLMARDAAAAARELIARGWLTAFQVYQLFLGKGDNLVLGSYVLLERLGEGAMGQVFKARHKTMGRLVAVKSLRTERLGNQDAIKRFEREIRAAGKISHPNFVLVFDADVYQGTHYYAMEFVDGPDLAHLVKDKGPLAIETACDYTCQAAVGLDYAHGQGLIHRDIKPSNLLLANVRHTPADGKAEEFSIRVTEKPTVKILDMGLARLVELAEESALTQEGKVLGTPDYIAPEQARNAHKADRRADLYSLGCTLYYLLTGRPPFPGGGTLIEKLMRHQTDEPVPIETIRPEVPESVRAILKRLITRKPETRYQTAAELVVALRGLRLTETPKPKTGRPIARQTIVSCWFYSHQGQVLGPMATGDIRARARAGELLPTDPVWPEGVEPGRAVPASALIDFELLRTEGSGKKAEGGAKPAWLSDVEQVEGAKAAAQPKPPKHGRHGPPLPSWLGDVAKAEEQRARSAPAPAAVPPVAPETAPPAAAPPAPPAASVPPAAAPPPAPPAAAPASPPAPPGAATPSPEPTSASLPDWIDDIRRAEEG